MLARIAYDQGRLEEAANLCQEALKRGLSTPDVLNLLGRSLMDAGKTEAAVHALQQATALPKPVSETFYLLGQAQLQARAFEHAKASFLRATAMRPDHTQAFFGLYTACLRLGQETEAQRYREQFQKLESADRQVLRERSAEEDSLSGLPLVRRTVARTLFGAGQVHGAHTNTAKALELVRKAAILDPENPAYRAALETQLLQRKAPEEVLRIFEELVAEQPENYLNYFFLGRASGRLQRWEQAERAYRKAQELQPAWAGGYRGLAEVYVRNPNQLPQARVMAQKAVELEPVAPSFYVLAVACLNSNDRAGALQAIRRALELSPKDQRYQELLRRIEDGPK
jgi:tetratricopeptide (TPR) repeat protein